MRPEALAEEDVVMWCEPVPLVRHLVGRVARAAAAGAHFTMTGASDLYAINDAMAGFAEVAADGHLVVGISSSAHRLTVDAGPMVALGGSDDRIHGAAEPRGGAPRELEPRRAALAELVDQLSFESFDEGELLHLLRPRSRPPGQRVASPRAPAQRVRPRGGAAGQSAFISWSAESPTSNSSSSPVRLSRRLT